MGGVGFRISVVPFSRVVKSRSLKIVRISKKSQTLARVST